MNSEKLRSLWSALLIDRPWSSERRRVTPILAITLAGMIGGALQGIAAYRLSLCSDWIHGDAFLWDVLERFAWIGAANGLSVGAIFACSRNLLIRLSLSPLIAIAMVATVDHIYCGDRPVYLWSSWFTSEEYSQAAASLRWGVWLGGTGALTLALTEHLLRRLGGKVRLQTIALLATAFLMMRLQSFAPSGWIETYREQPNYGCGTATASMYREVPLGIGELLVVLSTAALLLHGHLLARLALKLKRPLLIPAGVAAMLVFGVSGVTWASETMLWTSASPIRTVSFGSDRDEAVTLHEGGVLRCWEIARGPCEGAPRISRANLVRFHHGPIRSGTFALSRQLAAIGSEDGWIELWDLSTLTRLTEFRASAQRIRQLALSEDGSILAATGPGNRVYLWKLMNYNTLGDFHLESLPEITLPSDGESYGLGLSPEGSRIAICGQHCRVTVHETLTGKLLFRREENKLRYFLEVPILSKRGRFLASRIRGGRLVIDDLDRRTTTVCTSAISPLAFSPDGGMLLAGGRNSIHFLEVETARVLLTLGCEDGETRAARFTSDGRSCIVASEDSIDVFDHLPVVYPAPR